MSIFDNSLSILREKQKKSDDCLLMPAVSHYVNLLPLTVPQASYYSEDEGKTLFAHLSFKFS